MVEPTYNERRMPLLRRSGTIALLGALAASLGCGDSKKSGTPTLGGMANAGEGGVETASPFGGASSSGGLAAGGTTGGGSGGMTPSEEPWVDPYPRTWAKPELTRALATERSRSWGRLNRLAAIRFRLRAIVGARSRVARRKGRCRCGSST